MRVDGYLPIGDYAAIGDGRTCALVGRDGSIDWLCLPNIDSPPLFDRILDADGGRFELAPVEPYESERRYREGTNVLETTFRTAGGAVRVTDAMTLHDAASLSPLRELARVVDGLEGQVALRWEFRPRLDFGRRKLRVHRRGDGLLVAANGKEAFALTSWNAGDGEFALGAGERATLALSHAHMEPMVFPSRQDVERRVDDTASFWEGWSSRLEYDGPWRDAVVRSALALKLLAFSPSGCIVAAPTTSLPERIGGDRNWDYRFGWVRDGVYTLRALLALGCVDEARAFFWWEMHAARTTEPELRPLYCVDGGLRTGEDELELPGYRGSRPVRVGNGAATQLQLDTYGPLFEATWRFWAQTGSLGAARPRELEAIADFVAEEWRRPDSGIWESRDEPRDYVVSKAMCWTALDRARRLADEGVLSRHDQWATAADEIHEWVEQEGWDAERGSYVCVPGEDVLDASLLTMALCAYADARDERFLATADRIRRELARGPHLYRFTGAEEIEGAFSTCSFWLVDALARAGRRGEAEQLMEELVATANDVGLYAEEIDPDTGEHLGNMPQGLVHLALVNAAVSLAGGDEDR